MRRIIQNSMIQKIVVISAIVIALLFSSLKIVESGEVGIRVRLGKVTKNPVAEGINFKIPFIEKIDKMNVRVQRVEVTTNSSSKDLQDVDMTVVVNYRIDREQAVKLYKNVGKKYQYIVLEPAIEEGIKAVTSKYTAEELIIERSQVSEDCKKELDKKVSKYGLIINDFNIVNFEFSEEFSKAIEEKQVAEQKVLTAKQELEREKIEAEKRIVQAESEKKANELKQQSLTDNIIKEKFIEKWDGHLPKVSGTNSFIDASGLLE